MATDIQNLDPFKPSQPQIPGVTPTPPTRNWSKRWQWFADAEWRSRWLRRAGIPVAAVLAGAVLAWITFPTLPEPREKQTEQRRLSQPAASAAIQTAAPTARVLEEVPPGPVTVARVGELAKPWEARFFRIRRQHNGREVPAILIRLPNVSARSANAYWALVLEEPFGRCKLEYVTDRKRLEREFGYRAQHPMVVDPCNGSVYHPLRFGPRTDGAMLRGEVVAGPAIRPPLAILVHVRGNEIIAERTE
ncbi:MAG: hypothetical protein K6U09_10765 [Acidobacteriia bacterium]|jgi:hypothetical protein|nr:hypothetical protein [Terriglobia bacterium]